MRRIATGVALWPLMLIVGGCAADPPTVASDDADAGTDGAVHAFDDLASNANPAPDRLGVCCTVDACTERSSAVCTYEVGGLWVDATSCADIACGPLLGQSTAIAGASINDEDDDDEDDDDEAFGACCLPLIEGCFETEAEFCFEFGGEHVEDEPCDEACPEFREFDDEEPDVACCITDYEMCTYAFPTVCDELGGESEYDVDCEELCPDLEEVDPVEALEQVAGEGS